MVVELCVTEWERRPEKDFAEAFSCLERSIIAYRRVAAFLERILVRGTATR